MAEDTKLILIAVGLILVIVLSLAVYAFMIKMMFKRIREEYWVVGAIIATLIPISAIVYLTATITYLLATSGILP